MNTYYFVAGLVALVTGAIHSVLGEVLIFRHLRKDGFTPSLGAPPLRERNIRIIWATWHVATLLGWAFAGILLRMAFPSGNVGSIITTTMFFAYLGSGLLVLIATKGRHPGWIALSVVAGLIWLGTF